MALTSDRLKELTRQRMELIREIDKTPKDAALKEKMDLIVAELSKERHTLITNDCGNYATAIVPQPDASVKAVPEKILVTTVPVTNIKSMGKKETVSSAKIEKSRGSKKLSEFF